MYKIYIGKLKNELNVIPILFPNLGHKKENSIVYKNAFVDFSDPFFDLVDKPEKADFLMIPHSYFLVSKDELYLKHFIDASFKYNKKIIIFSHSDIAKEIAVPNSIIFRTTQYRSKKKVNEIMMPAYVEDLGKTFGLKFIKKGLVPSVSFCGWAKTESNIKRFIYFFEYILLSLVGRSYMAKGLIFRMIAIKRLSKSLKVKTNFVVRRFFSGNLLTAKLPEEFLRNEYFNNISNSDFVLSIKGDGNFSCRFYEALSVGRLPLFLDTECILPLEDVIDYSQFVCFVDYKDVNVIDQRVVDFYDGLTEDQYLQKQKKARECFERYLNINQYFKYMFIDKNLEKYIVNF